MMKLDIISRHPQTTPKPAPLLFVHGSFAEGRIWDEHFLPYFAAQGYQAHAFSLRGHGRSEGKDQKLSWRLADFVADLADVAATMPRPPVLIGHSMGGMIVQKYLESHPAIAGVVLIASVPPQGLLPTNMDMAFRHPFLFQQMAMLLLLGPKFFTVSLMRNLLFHTDLTDSRLRELVHYACSESQRVSIDMLGLDPLRLKPEQVCCPVLVQGAQYDRLVSPAIVRATAHYYRTDAHILPDMGHGMMMELNWQIAADHLLDWLEQCVTADPDPCHANDSPLLLTT